MDRDQYIALKQGDKMIQGKYTKADLEKMENKLWWVSTAGIICVALVVFLLIIPNIRLLFTESESMVPTISVGDLALFGSTGGTNRIDRGDIILFEPTDPTEEGSILLGGTVYYTKRVIGMPGERIRIEDGFVYINGDPLDEPYKVFSTNEYNASLRDMDEILIPAGYYFVMGDNRDHSEDSRIFGPIPYDSIRFSLIFPIPTLAGVLTGTNNDKLFIDG